MTYKTSETQPERMVLVTDNGIEYDTVTQYSFDEPDAVVTATEFTRKGVIVRRDVHAALKPKVLAPVAEM